MVTWQIISLVRSVSYSGCGKKGRLRQIRKEAAG